MTFSNFSLDFNLITGPLLNKKKKSTDFLSPPRCFFFSFSIEKLQAFKKEDMIYTLAIHSPKVWSLTMAFYSAPYWLRLNNVKKKLKKNT